MVEEEHAGAESVESLAAEVLTPLFRLVMETSIGELLGYRYGQCDAGNGGYSGGWRQWFQWLRCLHSKLRCKRILET